MRLLRFCLFFVLLLSSGAALAQEPHYFSPQMLPPDLLMPPPKEGSPAWENQIKSVVGAQEHITADDLAQAKNEQHFRFTLMTEDVAPNFTAEKLPKTFALLQKVFEDGRAVNEADKKFWNTRRPYVADGKRVKLLIDEVGNNSYPSGHTSLTQLMADVIGLLVPDKRAILRQRAYVIATHRVLVGVHYPVDLEGGRQEATLMLGALMASKDFQRDLAEARAEMEHNK